MTSLSRSTRISLAIARGNAASDGHAEVTPVHVALGVLKDYDNPAVAALGFLGVPLPELRRDLALALPAPGNVYTKDVVFASTAPEEAILNRAASESAAWGDRFIGAQHVLVALLRESEGPVPEVFARYGVTADLLGEKVRGIMIKCMHPGGRAAPEADDT